MGLLDFLLKKKEKLEVSLEEKEKKDAYEIGLVVGRIENVERQLEKINEILNLKFDNKLTELLEITSRSELKLNDVKDLLKEKAELEEKQSQITKKIDKINLKILILETLKNTTQTTQEIAKKLNKNRSTISALLNELAYEGKISKIKQGKTTYFMRVLSERK